METTVLSSKGQVIIPKSVRSAHHWEEGTEFCIQDVEEGILLYPIKPFPVTKLEDGIGCTGYHGPSKTFEEIDKSISDSIRKKWRKK